MNILSYHFKNHPCFKSEWAGFEEITPLTLIIGKNNTGKSHLLQFIDALSKSELKDLHWDLKMGGTLDKNSLVKVFPQNRSEGKLGGQHWNDHGRFLVDAEVTWARENRGAGAIIFEDENILRNTDNPYGRKLTDHAIEARQEAVLEIFTRKTHPFHGKVFRHLFADRDIRSEPMSNSLTLSPDGTGATNIVRRFLYSSDPKFPRELIQKDLLKALNQVFDEEGGFDEITVQHHDGRNETEVEDDWEIFLAQEHKGIVSLSNSGSGLKTIFLVLLSILVVPRIENKSVKDYIFAFEELENNLHPSLVRRLLEFICSHVNTQGKDTSGFPIFFLTTHSSVALDFFASDSRAQIVHVSHDGKTGKTRTIDQSSKAYDVIWDLGTRPSDLLQANGVIWVEGPSDRIYLNRWIELYSDGNLKEGRHYQCAFYGGSLLSNLQAAMNEDADGDLINLLKINPNAVVISDSDRDKKRARLKDRVRKIRDEFDRLDKKRSLHWVLDAREIENYLAVEFLDQVKGTTLAKKESPTQYESFFPKKDTKSYLERIMKRKSFDKSQLAALTTPGMTKELLERRFDLDANLKKIISIIGEWNR